MDAEITDINGAAELTGLAVQTLYNLRGKGEGPRSFSLRGRVRYYIDDVKSWIADEAGRSNMTHIRRTA